MARSPRILEARAAFPLDDNQLVVLLEEEISVASEKSLKAESHAGRLLRGVVVDPSDSRRLTLKLAPVRSHGIVIDFLRISGDIVDKLNRKAVSIKTPKFIHGIKDLTELKALQLDHQFPFASRLAGVHVSVACCTGCNGGVHDRNLVVLNHHIGGPWT